jgi:SAM-dependent methyltransferase
LACGNGAVVWIANEILNGQGARTKVTGVDYANIAPFSALGRDKKLFPMVSFLKNTSIEQLPFADGTIDVAVSQYGLEYSDIEKTIPEVIRVLKPAAKMCFVLHRNKSDLIGSAGLIMEIIDDILDGEKIAEKYLLLDELYNAAKNRQEIEQSAAIKRQRTQINMSLYAIEKKIQLIPGGVPMLFECLQNFEKEFPKQAANRNGKRKQNIAAAVESLQRYKVRMEGHHGAGLTDAELEQLIALIERGGFAIVENGDLMYREGANVGSVLVARRD